MNYQIGDMGNIKADDPIVEQIQDAYKHARRMCEESDEVIVGVWELYDGGGDADLVAIVYQGEVFVK